MSRTDLSEIATLRLANSAAEMDSYAPALDVLLATYEDADRDSAAAEEDAPAFSLSGLARCRTIAEPRRAPSRPSRSLNTQTAALLRALQAEDHAREDILVIRWSELPERGAENATPTAGCVLITEVDFNDWSESVAQRLSGAMALARHKLGLLASARAAK